MAEKSKNIPLLGELAEITAEEKRAYLEKLKAVLSVRIAYAEKHSEAPETAVKEWRRTYEWLSGQKTSLELILRGIKRLAAVREITVDNLLNNWALTDPKAAGYCAQKPLIKISGILTALGGGTDDNKPAKALTLVDSHVHNAFRDFVTAYLLSRTQKDTKGRFQKATCKVSAQELKEALSFKTMLDSEGAYLLDKALSDRIDQAIIDGAPDYHSSTANTQGPQIKTLMTSLGVAEIILPDGSHQPRAYMARNQVMDVSPRFAALLLAIDQTTYSWRRMNKTR